MDELINKAGEYFKSLNVENGLYKVIIQLPKSWGIIDTDNENLKVELLDKKTNQYVIIGDMKFIELKDIFEYIDKNTKENIEIEAKKILLQEKYTQLIQFFLDHTVEELQTLEFKINSKGKRGRKAKNKTEEVETENNPLVESDYTESSNINSTDSQGEPLIIKGKDIDKLGF